MELFPEASRVVAAELADAGSTEDAFGPSVQRLLHLLRTHLGMDVAWTSEFRGAEQVFRFVDAAPGAAAPIPGAGAPLSGAYCASVLAGKMPPLIPDSRADPSAALLDITFELQIGAYLGVPLAAPDGTVAGMLCATSTTPTPSLSERDLLSAKLIAELIEDLHRRALGTAEAQRQRARLRTAVEELCHGTGRRVVLQPIVDVSTGGAFAAEGLTRFRPGTRTPAEWFAVADAVGLRRELEVATARSVLATVARVDAPPVVAVNLSPDVVTGGELDGLIGDVDPRRLIVELTEHAVVPSYEDLHEVLEPHRRRGLRLAVDDAGAGYASLAHVLRLKPDLIKIDMSLVRGIDGDKARQALVGAMRSFAIDTGSTVVAEGVETRKELAALSALKIRYAQGYIFGKPVERPRWEGYQVGNNHPRQRSA